MQRITNNTLTCLIVSVLFICSACSSNDLSKQKQNNGNNHAANTTGTPKNTQNHKEQKPEALPANQKGQSTEEVQKAAAAHRKAELEKQLEDQYQQGYNIYFKKDYAAAINIENEVIKQDSTFYKAYTVKGIAQCFSGDFTSCMANIDKSLQLKPDYGFALFNKALAYELYRHYDEAITWYKKDLEIEDYVWSYYGISSIYGRRGDVANTVKYLKIAINLGPYAKTAAKTEKDFNNVRNSKEFQELVYN